MTTLTRDARLEEDEAVYAALEANRPIAPTRPVVRYHGGKWRIAPWIVGSLPPHRIYVEPFGGAASVLMRKPRSYAEVYNDKWAWIVNVFEILRDPESAAELHRRIVLTPFARDEFYGCGFDRIASLSDPIERARLSIFRSFSGFGSASMNGVHATGFRSNSNRAGTTPAHDWANYSDCIGMFVERLRGVVIENRDASGCMVQHDRSDTLHYVDPPYPHSTRNMHRGNSCYVFDMSDDDHRALADTLHGLSGMVVLSGYHCPLYDDDLFSEWACVERQGFADGAKKRTEVLWFNEAAWNGLRASTAQMELLG